VHLADHGWAKWAVFLGWRCELSAVVGVAASMAHGFGRNTDSFRVVASKTVRGTTVSVG
jgi:hypothetical protein